MWDNTCVNGGVTIGCWDWFSKEADWLVAELDKVRWASQSENVGMMKGEVGSHQRTPREARWACYVEKGYQARGKA